jgi:hypothetical protein
LSLTLRFLLPKTSSPSPGIPSSPRFLGRLLWHALLHNCLRPRVLILGIDSWPALLLSQQRSLLGVWLWTSLCVNHSWQRFCWLIVYRAWHGLNTPLLCCFPHFTPSMMQHRKHSTKSHMTRVPSDEGPDTTVKVLTTCYQLLLNGNFTSSSRAVHVTTSNAKISQNLVDNVIPEDTQTDHSQLQLDPAFLEYINEEFGTVRHQRSYVSMLNSLSLTGPADHAHPDQPY